MDSKQVLEIASEIFNTHPTDKDTLAFAAAIRSLPLVSKESEEKPVAWMCYFKRNSGSHAGVESRLPVIDQLAAKTQVAQELITRYEPLYLHPAECPKCAEYERMDNTLLEAHQCEKQRAEVAEAKCTRLEDVLEQNHIKHDSTTRALEAAEAKWSAEKHVRQQTQERLAKALDFIFDYVELSPDDVAGQERYDAITGGMK